MPPRRELIVHFTDGEGEAQGAYSPAPPGVWGWILNKGLSGFQGCTSLCVCVCVFVFSRAALEAYGGSQARGPIGDVAAGLHHSHSNTGFLTH